MSTYTWDLDKAAANLRKHAVSFDEADTVGDDPLRRVWPDLEHGLHDARTILIGHSLEGRLLTVITSEGGLKPRIISTRRATKRERHAYEARP
jgi:uncharacterized DUF497 family protein